MFLYSAYIQSVGPLKALYTLSPGRHVHSDTNSASPGSIQPCCILCEDYIFTFPSPSIARYSFIQLSELGHRGGNENAQTSKW